MSFDWKQYVLFAEDLSSRNDESALRSSISRAYYGAFCLSRNYLLNTNKLKSQPQFDHGNIHQQVIEYFNRSDDSDELSAGQLLNELRKKRNYADYDGNYSIEKNTIGKIVAKANEVIRIIDELES